MGNDRRLNTGNTVDSAGAVASDITGDTLGNSRVIHADSPPKNIYWDDTTTADVVYVGYADIGSATSAASWRIMKVDKTSKQVTYADGDSLADNIWDNRASLSYS